MGNQGRSASSQTKDLPRNEKSHDISVLGRQGILLIDYLQNGATVNAQYYSNLLSVGLKRSLQNKRRGKLSGGILYHHDNAPPHTAKLTRDTLASFGWTVLPHPPYSPDLAPSDFHLFGKLKEPLRGIHLKSLREVQDAVEDWRAKTTPEFYTAGVQSLFKRCQKCIQLNGGYIEKFDVDNT